MAKLFLSIGFFFLILFSVNAQNFEGIVEMRQVNADGSTHDLTWYIKKDKIAFEIKTNSQSGAMKMRFVPQPKQNSMLMVITNPQGESKNEIATRDISTDIDMTKSEVKENGSKASEYGELSLLIISTPNSVTETEVVKSIDVDLSKYASFLKNDYAVQALIKTKQIGFPLNSITKDKNGNLISKTTVVSVRKLPVSESYFK